MRQRTDAERRAVVEAWRVSGQTIEQFCRGNGISPESLMRWRNRPGVLGIGDAFLPVAVVSGTEATRGELCLIRVGDLVFIECGEHTDDRALTKAIRVAVATCGPNSGR